MGLKITRESSLNLTLKGSVGSFRVGAGIDSQQSLEVKYFLSHVGLNFETASNTGLLSELAPVREIFDFNSLEFDEIMQRDIDDSRVSAELIPYLLDEASRDLVKLFPPIIVMLLPTHADRNHPAPLYPACFAGVVKKETPTGDHGLHVTRAGEVGHEVFQFEQPISDGQILSHDLARFKINTYRSRLVIVDGQHRAMALLAIYRNLLDQWSDEKRAPYKEYYSQWTPNYIRRFNLKEIELPVMFCTVPALADGYSGDFDLRKAARAIFLTLNKTARAVSTSRNILLDDNDLISVFLRRSLSAVKNRDARSASSFRIWNVELDQFRDKLRVQSPMALTGVSHLYYIIEHLMMDNGNVTGASARAGSFQARTKLHNCLDRLDGRNILGSEVADSIRRDHFTVDASGKLGAEFDARYGRYLIEAFENFSPFAAHNRAAINLEKRIENYQDRQLRPILFEGQGISRVFEAHRDGLRKKLSRLPDEGGFKTDVPQIEAIADRLDATNARLDSAIREFRIDRAEMWLHSISDKGTIRNTDKRPHECLVRWFDGVFQDVFTTVAFEAALVCGFFHQVERAIQPEERTADVDRFFADYMSQINGFFNPTTVSGLKRVIRLFNGEPGGETFAETRIHPSNQTFRSVIYRGEMQPDQWPKYRYLLMEIWKPSDKQLAGIVDSDRAQCRSQLFASLHQHNKNDFCRENSKPEDALQKHELEAIFTRSFDAYNGMLKNLGAEPLTKEFAVGSIEVGAAFGQDIDPDLLEPGN